MSGALETARRLLAEALGVAPEALGEDAAIGRTPGWDSLAHVRLILAIEAHLGRELPPEKVVAVGALADVAALLDEAAGPPQRGAQRPMSR